MDGGTAMEIKRKCALTNREDRGQMTIEFVVAFPAALIIGLIVINALLPPLLLSSD